MSRRRLTISSLLCADEHQPLDRSEPTATNPQSPPYHPVLSGPGIPPNPNDYRGTQVHGPAHVTPDFGTPRSRTYPDSSQDSHDIFPPRSQSPQLTTTFSFLSDHAVTLSAQQRESREDAFTSSRYNRALVSPVSRENDPLALANPPSHQAEPPPIPSPRRSPDTRRSEYRLFEGSSYFSPPASSRSARSDSISSCPPPPPPPPFSPLPHQSSLLLFQSHTNRHLNSPELVPGFQNYDHRSMSQSSPHANQAGCSKQDTMTSHPQVVLTSSSASQETTNVRTSHQRSTSQSGVSFLPPRSCSVTALPNLLNADLARPSAGPTSHGSPGGLGGLEALVQAATQERRRLSGELPTPSEIRETARMASLSPVLNRAPPSLPRLSQSPVSQRSPMLPSPRVDARVNSLAVIPLGIITGHDGEPPVKKRRRTGSGMSEHASQPPANVVSPTAPPAISTSAASQPPLTATPPSTQPPLPSPMALYPTPASLKPRSIGQLLSDPPKEAIPAPASPRRTVSPKLVSLHAEAKTDRLMPSPVLSTDAEAAQGRLGEEEKTHAVPSDHVADQHDAAERNVVELVEEGKTQGLLPMSRPVLMVAPPVPESMTVSSVLLTEGISPATAITQAEATPVMLIQADESPETPAIMQADDECPGTPGYMQVDESAGTPAKIEMQVDALSSVSLGEQTASLTFADRNAPATLAADQATPKMEEVEEMTACDRARAEEPICVAEEPAPEVMGPSTVVAEGPPDEELTAAVPDKRALCSTEACTSAQTTPAISAPVDESEASYPCPVESVEIMPTGNDVVGQQDPHEWLLEHYADAAESAVHSRHTSPPPEDPPQTPAFSDSSPPPDVPAAVESKPRSNAPVSLPATSSPPRKAPSLPRFPTPTVLLEQELDAVNGDVIKNVISLRSHADTDFALELNLAVSATPPDRRVERDVSMSNELDEELLSLLDDKPRHSQSSFHHQPKGEASHQASSASRTEETCPPRETSVKKPAISLPLPRDPSIPLSTSERDVMPPPVAPQGPQRPSQPVVGRLDPSEGSVNTSVSSKKKDPAIKPVPKAKQPKTKAKPTAKPRPTKAAKEKEATAASTGRLTPSGSGAVAKGKKTAPSAVAATAAKRGVSMAAGPSRSRSTSEMPTPTDPLPKPKAQPEEEEESEEETADDKLYCICKTSYDEDRVMIACDRCDEWYHTQCLNMNDLEVDLIDQFVCPSCIKASPNIPLETTYKQRCLAGLKHPHSSSPSACHKAARGAFSKFCSDECGVLYMQRRIQGWGGDQAVLWASVRDIKQREGVVVKVQDVGVARNEKRGTTAPVHGQESYEVQRPSRTQRERAISRLRTRLDEIAPKREQLKKELEVILWRQKLLKLAAVRADRVEECGWDQRLCFDDEEYAEFAGGVLESYEEPQAQLNGDGEDTMHVDGAVAEDEGWWCRGKRKCQRHAGWQKLRANEFEFDQEMKDKSILVLTTQEREIRKQLEDTISQPIRRTIVPGHPLQHLNGQHSNGIKAKPPNGTSRKKGKQKT